VFKITEYTIRTLRNVRWRRSIGMRRIVTAILSRIAAVLLLLLLLLLVLARRLMMLLRRLE